MSIEEKFFLTLSYVIEYCGGHTKRCFVEGEKVFSAKNIIKCGIQNLSGGSFKIVSVCLQSSNPKNSPWEINLFIPLNKQIINSATCTCPAGQEGKCKHVIATLLYINQASTLNKLSSTELRQNWGKVAKKTAEQMCAPCVLSENNCCTRSNYNSVMIPTNLSADKENFARFINVLEFSIEPSDIAVPEGNSALLQCAGNIQPGTLKEGKTAPNIRWRGPDGQDIGIVGDTFRSQSPNGSLYVSSVEENRGLTGLYQCLLSLDGIGTIVSRSAKVSIAKFPEMYQDSSEIYLSLGQTAYFQCIVGTIDNSHIKYQITWTKDDSPLIFDDSRMLQLPSGALEIDEVIASDRGTYQCNVSSENFWKLSTKSNLNIKSPSGVPENFAAPSFATVPIPQTVREGDTVTLDCVANGNPKPIIKWLKNGEDIDMNDLDSRFRIIGTGSLQISTIEDSDDGNYQCRASNTIDSQDAAASLKIQVPPKFIQSPKDKVAVIKDELELECAIQGEPPPTIQWLKNGDLITSNDYMQLVSVRQTSELNLKILGLISIDSGMFQCIGTNPAGSVQASARLQIVESETELANLMNRNLRRKMPMNQASSSSLLSSSGVHQRNDLLLKDDNRRTLQKTALDSLRSSKNRNVLAVGGKVGNFDVNNNFEEYENEDEDESEDDDTEDDDNEDDEGSIHPWGGEDPNKLLNSLMSNRTKTSKHEDISYFSQTSISPLTRKLPLLDGNSGKQESSRVPSAPRDLQAQIVKPRFITLNWMEPLNNPEEVTSYTVFYKMTSNDRERKITTKSPEDQEVNIQSLLPGKTYLFRVVANSNYGTGESSEILKMQTQSEENIAGSPENLQGAALSHNEISLLWESPVITNGEILKYRIFYSEDYDYDQEKFTDSTALTTSLTDLKPHTEYTISVVAFNKNGMGDHSKDIKVKTYSAAPTEPPTNVSLETTSATSLTIRWEPPAQEEQNGQITGYKIRYRKLKKQVVVETTSAIIRHYEIKKLDKKSAYQVKIAAININGTGPFSEWLTGETYENDLDETQVPGSPSFIITKPSAESIAVSWGAPTDQRVKVRGYILGWGKGIPDEVLQELDENSRTYVIVGLEPNNQYVITLSARNLIGNSQPVYDNVRTREEMHVDAPIPLEVPVGLRAITMSATSIVVFWTDTMLNKNQHAIDNRHYVVRYNPMNAGRFKHHNTTDLNCMISDLKSNTQYEFAVKVVKGKRESAWSMSVLNTTMQAVSLSAPRDLKARPDQNNPINVLLTWNSPKHSSGTITGYVVFYTTDKTRDDRDWSVHAVVGDIHQWTTENLKPLTAYYFKIQSRTGVVLGPFSNIITHTTGKDMPQSGGASSSNLFNEMIVYIIVAMSVVTLLIASVVIFILCRRKPIETPEHAKKSYQKNNAGIIKPPDLWIHHDQMELKNMEKNHLTTTTPGCNDGASSSGAMTLPRSVVHDFDNEPALSHVTNSLDKRTYVPGYMTTPVNGDRSQQYTRQQYSMPRAHVSMEPTLSQQNLSQSQTNSLVQTPENPYTYDTMPPNYGNVTYAPGISVDAPKRGQGHPLKSFSVPAPPVSTPVIPGQGKHVVPAVTIRPQNSSPYKKPVMSTSMSNRLQTGTSVAHSSDEIQRLAPSTSTEELNQEMANLEGLMKDLSAITANEFEC